MASYVLATNANIPRIQGMIERVCRTFGTEMDGFYTFPRPDSCWTAARERKAAAWAIAAKIHRAGPFGVSGGIDFPGLMSMDYQDCVRELVELPGIGPKVADCVTSSRWSTWTRSGGRSDKKGHGRALRDGGQLPDGEPAL